MKVHDLKYVEQSRAASLLGMSEYDLCRISRESGFGHKEGSGESERLFFTYEELRKICVLSAQHVH